MQEQQFFVAIGFGQVLALTDRPAGFKRLFSMLEPKQHKEVKIYSATRRFANVYVSLKHEQRAMFEEWAVFNDQVDLAVILDLGPFKKPDIRQAYFRKPLTRHQPLI